MSKALLIQVTVYEGDDTDRSNSVTEQHVHVYDGSYGYEVSSLFDKLGRRYASVVDPNYSE